jgi:hypothetical protein
LGGAFSRLPSTRWNSGSFVGSFAMPLSDDPWIAQYSVVEPERLHALGMITLYWNHCERNLLALFCDTFNLVPRIGWIIAHDMGDVSMCSKIQGQLEFFEKSANKQISARLYRATEVYDACRLNRNALTHFTIDPKPDSTFSFVRTKGIKYEPREFPSSLSELRRVAIEVQALSMYLWKLHKAISTFQKPNAEPLPPLLGVPELLVKPPRQTHGGQASQLRQRQPKGQKKESAAKRRQDAIDRAAQKDRKDG